MPLFRCVAFVAIFSSTALAAASRVAPEALAAQYNLPTSTILPFPSSTQSTADTDSLLVSQWSLSKGRIQDGPQNLAFVNDPFPSNPVSGSPAPTGPVLRVEYPEGSFSHDTGGSQFYTLWNATDGSSFNTMMLSYELAFDSGFDWVKGGKLPGLRGGLNDTGCSGGNKADGLDCWSSRLMWRKGGTGEVYAYIPMPNNLCSEKSIICNSDFGVSVNRGSFGFVGAQWMRVTQLIQLNNPPNIANGIISLYYNDILVLTQTGLQLRATNSIAANGLYFSTFFGGSDTSWATPVTTHTYFRNIQLWGGPAASNATGALVQSNAPPRQQSSWPLAVAFLTLVIGSVFCL